MKKSRLKKSGVNKCRLTHPGVGPKKGKAPRTIAAPFSRPAFSQRLVIMVKEPQAGRVKTRLGRQIGTVAATFFYRHAASAVIRRLSASTRWRTCLAVAPDTHTNSRFWPRRLQRLGQGTGDLGQRMQSVMDWPGAGPLLIVGTDIPAIAPRHIAQAFRRLGSRDAILGATPDGGYWLVGLRRSPRVLSPFGTVRWSTDDTMADTKANLAGHAVAEAAVLCDVDSATEWTEVRAWAGRIVMPRSALDA